MPNADKHVAAVTYVAYKRQSSIWEMGRIANGYIMYFS